MKRTRLPKLIFLCCSLLLIISYNSRRAHSSRQSDDQQLAKQAIAILRENCLHCHGEDRTSGLDLRTRESLLKGGSRGAAVKPGDSAGSLLFLFISGKENPRMPQGGQLSNEQIESIKKWIDKGLPWADGGQEQKYAVIKSIPDEKRNYWAFRKPLRAPLPTVKNRAWIRNSIDAFILSKLEEKGLQPSPRADKQTLLRRVTFDLTGLPPSPDEIKAFLADRSPDAYEKVVKRLLSSPRYGERWAQHWLDVVRFGETNGFELDADRDQSWRYRDYVVKSLNDDKPYDRFIIEQIAGDEIDPENFELRVATGFLRAGPQHVVAGNQDLATNRQEWLTEAMFGVGNGMMGLTVGCARCHDHKFDPIPQADYYRLQSFFAAADNYEFKRPTKEQEETHKAAIESYKETLKPVQDRIAAIEKPYKDRLTAEKRSRLEPIYLQVLAKDEKLRNEDEKRLAKDAQRMLDISWDELVAAISPEDRVKRAALRSRLHKIELDEPEPLPKALSVADALKPTPAMHVLRGGDPHRPGDLILPRYPSVLMPADAPTALEIKPVEGSTGRRLSLALWLTRADHPLTARVMVNRLWHYHFGRGIVGTPNDFGRNGMQPSHPELLDWLATEFVGRGWSLKQIHRLMVLSNTYRQSSTVDETKARIDPENRLFWRMNRQRLDAEAIRDAVLAVSGTLTEQMRGPSIRVPLEPEVYDTIFTESEPDNLWPVHPDQRQHTRRTLYLVRKRNVRLPMLVAFDAPDLISSCGARSVSVHSLQALTLMNSDFMFRQSKALAERLFRGTSGDRRSMTFMLYDLVLGRKPQLIEIRAAQGFLEDQTVIIRGRIARGEPVATFKELPASIEAATAAAWVDLCLATMNLNEFVYLK